MMERVDAAELEVRNVLMKHQNTDLLDLSHDELMQLIFDLGEKRFRVKQLLEWMYQRAERDFEKMTNLPVRFRAQLAQTAIVGAGSLEELARDGGGKTAKALFKMNDGALIEAVSMLEAGRHAICVSSQAGCAMGCLFCATAQMGFQRDLTAGEIMVQAVELARRAGPFTNVVFMGMGEPLLNVGNVLKAIQVFTHPWCFALGTRRVTVSTCGIIPGIEALARSETPVRLALSLNSPFDDQRRELMPVTIKYPLPEVITACESYLQTTGKTVLIEYVALAGVNTGRKAARELARIAKRLEAKINLIEYNPAKGSPFAPPESAETLQFRDWVRQDGGMITVRFRRGREIAAGCGQLAGKRQHER